MPPFRIVVRHPDRGHHNHAWGPVGPVFDAREDVDEALADVTPADLTPAPTSLPVEERVRVTLADRLAELEALGYDRKVEELVVAEEGVDDAGTPAPVAHKWKDA